MTIFQAFILGAVQGLTEFLPVSSSGHLVLFSKLPWWSAQPLVFDTTLHLATALTLIIYFYRDLSDLVRSFINDVFTTRTKFLSYAEKSKLLVYILVGSIPAGVFGLLFESDFEQRFRAVNTVALFLLLGSILMWFAQKVGNSNTPAQPITLKKSFIVGVFQSLALFPGVSRSGATISGSLLVGLPRYDAARFSFLLSLPIVLMAGLYKLVTTDWTSADLSLGVLSVGFLTSLLVGLAVVHFLLAYLKNRNLTIFIWYRLLLVLFLLFVV